MTMFETQVTDLFLDYYQCIQGSRENIWLFQNIGYSRIFIVNTFCQISDS